MSRTVVLQSHAPLAVSLVHQTTETVRLWADTKGFAYRYIDDALFDPLPSWVLPKVGRRRQMAADIARLIWIGTLLDEGAERVIWLDADVYIFAPERFLSAVDPGFAFGREYWIAPGFGGGLKVHKNVHNALLDFSTKGRSTLDFYRDTALRMLKDATDTVPAQFIGPKLLTALHNVVQFPLTDAVGMASPCVISDLAAGGGPAWTRLLTSHGTELAALNLCSSMWGNTVDGIDLTTDLVSAAVAELEDSARNPRRAAPATVC